MIRKQTLPVQTTTRLQLPLGSLIWKVAFTPHSQEQQLDIWYYHIDTEQSTEMIDLYMVTTNSECHFLGTDRYIDTVIGAAYELHCLIRHVSNPES